MIKFFRHIRQRLLSENKFTRYLFYAIGEIVLVVIGILIALQINNWNEQRKDRLREVTFLKGLKADFSADLKKMEFFIKDREIKSSSAYRLLYSSYPVTAHDVQTLDSLHWRVCTWKTFVPSTKTMDELTSSGNLSLISNDSIKSRMLDLVQDYQDLAVHTEHMRREYDYYIYDRSAELKEMSPFVDWDEFLNKNKFTSNVVADEERLNTLKAQWTSILQDLTFINGLKLATFNNHGMYLDCEVIHLRIEELIEMIEEEIGIRP